jgi:hypothetical protein
MNYCFFCGYDSENAHNVCYTCKVMTDVDYTYTPSVCGDDVCYLVDGELNLDGECIHAESFNQLAQLTS